MILLAALSVVRLALLLAYCFLVFHGDPWWADPLLVVFVFGWGCKPPAAIIAPRRGGQVEP